jgi:hypothetical protein
MQGTLLLIRLVYSQNWRTAGKEAWCHPARVQLVKNPEATRQNTDKTLACEELWVGTDAMREALRVATQKTCTRSRFDR